ncbi:MAG: amidase [Thermodesulfobacteriota bacterium]
MSEALHRKSVAELARLVSRRDASPREVVEHFVRRIESENPRLNAFVTVCADSALRRADELTEELAHGTYRGPLHGIPVAIKDLTDTAGVRTTYGSKLFRDHVPAEDAEPVRRLLAAGAVIVGKTNTHEFAFGTTTNNPHFGATQNPWRTGHVPGGSSGGSGAAIGGGLAPLATGTDTGGSIRIPSAACGCVGIKPSYGRVSLRGTYPLATTLDHIGPLARTAEDCALALGALAGFDREDPSSRDLPAEDFGRDIGRSLRGLRIGDAPAYRPMPASESVLAGHAAALRTLRELGAEVVEVVLPDAQQVNAATSILLLAESYAQHAELLAASRDAYGADVREQLEMSAGIDVPALIRAQHARERIARTVGELLTHDIDVLLLPTMAVTAPLIGETTVDIDGNAVPIAPAMASYTLLHNATRLPTVAVPTGLDGDGLPTSVQLTAADGREALALGVAHALETALWPHSRRWPGETRAR